MSLNIQQEWARYRSVQSEYISLPLFGKKEKEKSNFVNSPKQSSRKASNESGELLKTRYIVLQLFGFSEFVFFFFLSLRRLDLRASLKTIITPISGMLSSPQFVVSVCQSVFSHYPWVFIHRCSMKSDVSVDHQLFIPHCSTVDHCQANMAHVFDWVLFVLLVVTVCAQQEGCTIAPRAGFDLFVVCACREICLFVFSCMFELICFSFALHFVGLFVNSCQCSLSSLTLTFFTVPWLFIFLFPTTSLFICLFVPFFVCSFLCSPFRRCSFLCLFLSLYFIVCPCLFVGFV